MYSPRRAISCTAPGHEMKPDLTAYLGRHVLVTVDRPAGSRHPRHPDLVYPMNYGFLPGTISGDGMAIDVYVLGIDAPVDLIECVVIAVAVRADDAEDKLVAAPTGHSYSAAQIAEAVQFQERYFDSRIVLSEG